MELYSIIIATSGLKSGRILVVLRYLKFLVSPFSSKVDQKPARIPKMMAVGSFEGSSLHWLPSSQRWLGNMWKPIIGKANKKHHTLESQHPVSQINGRERGASNVERLQDNLHDDAT
ncbi:hypothetical protein N7462_011280 [Penicillium macrosclerotiorum]|uniref:uncharacterized protein n=1 Tax=Penicillium macrosclerotiorum TaxID=303699 RepID=UPI002548846C|nr:uncharacterized protein N7462_011280 [Penicillium macrosclerotiorum]KAJ5666871.1 hypothetical protein N7462_011280 [Penicillium macrosclerotiorum]